MTCREKLAIEHPEMVGGSTPVECRGCPQHYGYAKKPQYCDNIFDFDDEQIEVLCQACWDRKVEEKEEEKMKKEFTKADLKTGMVVELRRGNFMLVIKQGIRALFVNRDGHLADTLYNNDLSNTKLNSFDVVRIYNPEDIDKITCINGLYEKHGNLIWERVEKMTLVEIEKKLGCKIEIIEENKP
jgi:hypothetical protein